MSNAFNKVKNENNSWFSNQSFGIQTESGFIGMSWSPNPQQTRTLTPKLTFYVSTGDYGSNDLADWNDVSNDSAEIDVPSSFKYNKCTVTYTATGGWNVTPGEPQALALAKNLDWFLSDAHGELVALAYLSKGRIQTDYVASVRWDTTISMIDGQTFLSGTLTVKVALAAAFTFFILGGLNFILSGHTVGGTTVHFSYSGDKSVEAVKALFTAGAQLYFGGA